MKIEEFESNGIVIAEGVSGTWFFHLSKPAPGRPPTRAICGSQVMLTGVPLKTWGQVGHLNERYCEKCMAAALLMPSSK